MKNLYFCLILLFLAKILNAQDCDCQRYQTEDGYLRYTSYGYQHFINGNHSKAINESKKKANIIAENELLKMVKSSVSRVVSQMWEEDSKYIEMYVDTLIVSSYNIIKAMRTVCQSETKLIDNIYVSCITKEICIDDLGDMIVFQNDNEKKKFKKILKSQK